MIRTMGPDLDGGGSYGTYGPRLEGCGVADKEQDRYLGWWEGVRGEEGKYHDLKSLMQVYIKFVYIITARRA